MGWWPFRGGSSGGDVRAQRLPGDSAAKAAAQQAAQDKQLDELLKQAPAQESDILAASLPKPTSIFEFGEGVPIGGDVLRGMCAGSDPDAIHACTWTIEQAQGRGREKKPKFRVEF